MQEALFRQEESDTHATSSAHTAPEARASEAHASEVHGSPMADVSYSENQLPATTVSNPP